MCKPQSLVAIHAQLLHDLDCPASRMQFMRLKEQHACFAPYASWPEMAEALGDRRTGEHQADAVLRCILAGFVSDPSPLWSMALCCSCFRVLVATYRPRQHWHADAEEVWQEAVLVFLDVCRRIAAKHHSHGLLRRIANETSHRLHEEFASRWRMSDAEHPTDHSDMQALVDPRQDLGQRETLRDLTEQRDLALARLLRHRALGTITAADCDLLIRTRLEGQSLREAADIDGRSYDATKKRAQRAELAMARVERPKLSTEHQCRC